MSKLLQTKKTEAVALLGLLVMFIPLSLTNSATAVKNSWRGITPLHSTAQDVARVIGVEADSSEAMLSGPFKVDGGEVTFSYLTSSLAKIYRAPRSMVGKVFTVSFNPSNPGTRADVTFGPGFKRCAEDHDTTYYYFVNDSGVAYRFLRRSDQLETIIYQPSRAEVRSLAVNAQCVF